MYYESHGTIGSGKVRGSGCVSGITVGNFEMCAF